MKDPIVKLKTLHAAMVADKESAPSEIEALEKQIAEAEENVSAETVKHEGKSRKKR